MTTISHHCCQTHLAPLLERISVIEGKLLVEVERREKEYNQLLTSLLSLKRSQGEQQQPYRAISRANAQEITQQHQPHKARNMSAKKKLIKQKERIRTTQNEDSSKKKVQGVELVLAKEGEKENELQARLQVVEMRVDECGR